MTNRKLKSLIDCIEKATANNRSHESMEIDADFTVDVKGKTWHCYTVAIFDFEFILYCDKGTATYLVDIYGNRYTCELFDWQYDDE